MRALLADNTHMSVRPVVLWFAGSGILMAAGIVGTSVLAPGKGVGLNPREDLLFGLSGLLCIAGFVSLVTSVFWCLFCSLLTVALTRFRAKADAQVGESGFRVK